MDAQLNVEVTCEKCHARLSAVAEEVSGKIRIEVSPCQGCSPEPDPAGEEISLDVIINDLERQEVRIQAN